MLLCRFLAIAAFALFSFADLLPAAEPYQPDDEPLPAAQRIPFLRILPQPGQEFAVRMGGREITRYYTGSTLRRPFLFPIVGPSGESLTRIGHPHDPDSHSHHNSVWVGHNSVAGVDFWSDRGGQIVHRRFDGDGLIDGAGDELPIKQRAGIKAVLSWVAPDGKTLLEEKRQMWFIPGYDSHWLLVLDMELTAPREAVELGKTPFGPMAVRMAKTIGVHDGGGLIRNSAGGRNEAGCFWKPAKWVDYSGPVTNAANEGITLMDHPSNPHHPPPFHVRDDGWMGVALTQSEPLTIEVGKPLHLRYGLWVHAGVPAASRIDSVFAEFAKLELPAKKE